METIKKYYKKYKEYINYLIFGLLSMIINWLSFSLFVKGFGMSEGIPYTVANFLSWTCAVLFAFFTNKLFVFESKTWNPSVAGRELASFFSARIFTGVFEWAGVPFLNAHGLGMPLFGVKGLWAKILVTTIVVIMNYVFSKYLIFIKRGHSDEKE